MKMRVIRILGLTIVAAVSGSGVLYGQTMSLKDCMEYAISNSTKVLIRNAETADARIARRDAVLAAFMPSISANTYAYYNFGRNIDPQTNTYFNQTSFHNNYGLSAGITLFDGFKAVNNVLISKTGLEISESREKQAESEICLAVMEAYYNTVYYKRLADVYEQQVADAEASLTKIRKQEELGQKGYADVVQAEADLADCKYGLTDTRNMYRNQLTVLSDLMFWPEDKELIIDSELPEPDMETESVDVEYNSILAGNRDFRIASLNELNSERELSTARWQLLPKLSLSTGWSTSYFTMDGVQTDPFNAQFRNNAGEYVEMSLSIPLFEGLRKHSTIARKRNARVIASAEKEQKGREVIQEFRRAAQDYEGAVAAYLQAEHKAQVQQEAYRLNMKKLEQGLVSPLEFSTINGSLLRANADLMNSLFKLVIKQSVVRYYRGIDYIDQF
ncbi:MAG: TolC family protein [Bacteroidaceae bacterium]|nr:TolC family protein [Bacteroidaceae bacterium]